MREITANEYGNFITAKDSFVIHFWAEWNGYDVEQRKILDIVESKNKQILFYRMNVDIEENCDICKNHNVQGPPTIVFYRSGRLVHRVVGLIQEIKMNKIISIFMNNLNFES